MNNNHCDDLVDGGIYRNNTVTKKNNETNKNLGRPFLVVIQHPENQTTFGNIVIPSLQVINHIVKH